MIRVDGSNDLERELTSMISGEVDFSVSARALFASDASNYRIVPLGVVFPRDRDDVLAALKIARRFGVPITARGGGTSTGGQTVGPGLVIDCSRHLDHVLEIDVARSRARVEPGIVLDVLQDRLIGDRLRFGPDPSTHDRCTVGGMIGNNACGAHSMRWGKTDENVLELTVATYYGEVLKVSTLDALGADPSPYARELAGSLSSFVERYGDAIRNEMGPPMPRRVSGYGLAHLLPEHGGNLARALVGTEGTCVMILDATLRLVAPPDARVLLVLGFGDLYAAADFVPELIGFEPFTIEGLDARLVELARHTNESASGASLLPPGNGWLLLEIGGDDTETAIARADEIVAALARGAHPPSFRIVAHLGEQRAVWRLREDGAGLATRLPDGSEAWPGWEDAAVPPEHLGEYLRGFDALLESHGRQGMHYGHYGEGCMHIRIDFDLLTDSGRGDFRRFIEAAADLVVSFGGSLSGEHGDGQARSELLHKMYPPIVLEAFSEFKAIFDPDNKMNPGRIVAARRIDEDLRVRSPRLAINHEPHLALHADHGDLERSARRCVGVGKCRRLDGGAMCPSFQATRDERDSTRGRARLLSEMFAGDLVTTGWRSREVLEALDLCLSCKACASDCPVGVDMAAYKAEFLSHHYAGRLRPMTHYSLGYLPLIARIVSPFARLVNLVFASPLATVLKRLGGIDVRRALPKFAERPLLGRGRPAVDTPDAILWPDTFTNFFAPVAGEAAIEVMEALDLRVALPGRPVCCGLTWYSTGQIGRARKALGDAIEVMAGLADSEVPIVVLEPSCASMLRDEITEVLADDARAAGIAGRILSFSEFVVSHADGRFGELFSAVAADPLVQVHCHQRATSGYGAEAQLLASVGAGEVEFETNCCGLAGNFGFEAGHFAISETIARRSIINRIEAFQRSGSPVREVVADGFSCRTQIGEIAGARARHIAEVLRDALRARRAGSDHL